MTTRELDRVRVEFVDPLAQAYRRRWGIGTSYRKVDELLSKTTSRTFSVRLFYFLLAVGLYNLWVLMNPVIGSQHTTETTQMIPTAIFREFLGMIPYG